MEYTSMEPHTAEGVVSRAVQILGGLAGFGVLVYAVGAAIMWLRFATTGFEADLALAQVSRDRLVSLGFRYVIAWVLLVLLLLVLMRAVAFRWRWAAEKPDDRPISHLRGTARTAAAWIARYLVPILVALAVGSAFLTWSALTVVLTVLSSVLFARWYRRRYEQAGPALPVALFIASVSALASLGWQLQINLPYDHANFVLKGQPLNDAIYFGEKGDVVYLSPRERPPSYAFTRDILVYPRDQFATLRLTHEQKTLCTRVQRPAVALWHGLQDFYDTIRQHLRRTGQPLSDSEPQTAQPLPVGRCPPLE